MSGDFEPEQKRYLEGFVAGLQIAKQRARRRPARRRPAPRRRRADRPGRRGISRRRTASSRPAASSPTRRSSSANCNPFDGYEKLKAAGRRQRSAEGRTTISAGASSACSTVAPAQKSYMCRLRIPNGILTHWQFAGLADLAERYAGGYAHVTTRANLQMREIEPKNAVAMVEAIQDLGLCSRGSGADNIRNVTGTPTAGIDPQELIDTRPYAREWHFHILNDRSLYGLPRKFNVGFDGGGRDRRCSKTPTTSASRRSRSRTASASSPASGSASLLGGITGHQDFRPRHRRHRQAGRRDAGRRRHRARLHRPRRPHQPRQGAAEIRARRLGLREIPRRGRGEARRASSMRVAGRSDRAAPGLRPRSPISACIRRSRPGSTGSAWCCRSARLTAEQMRGLAEIAARFRRRRDPPDGLAEPADLGRAGRARRRRRGGHRRARALDRGQLDPRRAGRLHRQCRLQVRDVRHQAPRRGHRATGAKRASRSTRRSTSISPAAPIPARSTTSAISGCSAPRCRSPTTAIRSRAITSMVGGGFGPDAACGREIYRDVKAEDAPRTVERMLKAYLAHRAAPDESFLALHAPARDRGAQDAVRAARRRNDRRPRRRRSRR